MESRGRIATVISGSLTDGLQARLDTGRSVEDLRVGKYVLVTGRKTNFFSMVTDVALAATNDKVLYDPPTGSGSLADQIISGTSTFGMLSLAPMLMLDSEAGSGPMPVRTIPPHFSPVYDAEESDYANVFGKEEGRSFEVGRPLDVDVPICIDLDRFVQRSNGVFGKSGTGKSFLTRLLLCGTIKTGACTNLIFDMHSEYGWDAVSEDKRFVKGLRQLFGGGKVMIFSIDPESSRKRGVSVDRDIKIGLNQIEVEDIALLQDELKLNNTAVESAYLLVGKFGQDWLKNFLATDPSDISDLAKELNAHPEALSALHRKLQGISRREFVVGFMKDSAIEEMMLCIQKKIHIVLEFGNFNSTLDYLLVANIITRRLHEMYVKQTQKYLQSKNDADKPNQLMITIEEAHKFLNPGAAKQTIFSTIAREMRKFYVTLLVVDQRPSGIDSEVLSQIGTRIVASLSDEHDIDAVFTGVSGGSKLRSVLASLDSREQAMVLGHAVPMPVTIRSRKYDEAFYSKMTTGQFKHSEPLEKFFGEE